MDKGYAEEALIGSVALQAAGAFCVPTTAARCRAGGL
jgi:hypothetical protein